SHSARHRFAARIPGILAMRATIWACLVWATTAGGSLGCAQAPAPASAEATASLTNLLCGDATPIDLASALQLAGVANPELLLCRQRVVEAVALRQLAAAQILPDLNY